MKNVIVAIVVGIFLFTVPVTAAPLEISGEATIRFQSDTAKNAKTQSGTMFSFTLRGEQKIGRNVSLFARLGAQYATNPALADFSSQNVKSAFTIDQFGLVYKPGKFTYTLGRQEAIIGTTALLYSRSETNIGKNTFVDGITINGSIGAFDVAAIAARENNLWLDNNSLYAIRGGYNFSKNFNAGLTWAQYQYHNAATTHHWATDATVKFGKNALTVEYAQSNSRQENKAYAATWTYDFNDKTAIYISNFRVEANADMGGQSDFDNNNRGFYYGLKHTFTDKLSMEFIYKDQILLADKSKNTKVELWLKNKF